MAESEESKPINVVGLGKLPKFDGKGNVRRFLKDVNKRGKIEKWSDEQKCDIVKYLCVENAEAFLNAHPETDDLDYDELCERLENRFARKISKTEAYSSLLSVKQNRQTVEEYAGKIESLAAEYVESIKELADESKRSELLGSIFISGLEPYLKRALVITAEDEDFDEIVRMAKKCEIMFGDTRRNVATLNVVEYGDNRQKNGGITCWHCGENHMRKDCPDYNNQREYPRRGNFRGASAKSSYRGGPRGRGWSSPSCQCSDRFHNQPKNF